jgi:glycosyltransferase involved in cell wall biosynthesis
MKSEKKVVISLLFVRPGKIGGVEHFCKNLLKGFIELHVENRFLLVVSPELAQHEGWKTILNAFEVDVREPGVNARLTEFLSLKNQSHIHLNLNYITPLFARRNITVIHDALFKHFKGYFSTGKYVWLLSMQRFTIKKARTVVCISEAVKEDLASAGREIEVIYNPIDASRFEPWQAPAYNNKIRVACLAANYPHKNLETIITAVANLQSKGVDAELELIGQKPGELVGGNFSEYGQRIADLLAGKSYIFASGYLPEKQIVEKLRSCHLFLFPSLFEGFGMPPVEMLASGMPVLASDLPVLKEVTRRHAHYVSEPKNPNVWVSEILNIMANYEATCLKSAEAAADIQKAYHCAHIANQYLGLIEKLSG